MAGLTLVSQNIDAIVINENASIEGRVNTVRQSLVNKINDSSDNIYKLEFNNGVSSKLSSEEKALLTWVNWDNGWNNWVD